MADGISWIRGLRGAPLHLVRQSILRKSEAVRKGLFQPKRFLARQLNRGHKEISTRVLPPTLPQNSIRFSVGVVGAVIGFAVSTMYAERGVAGRLKDLNLISCANAVEAYDEDEDDFVKKEQSRKSKRSAQFNFIADAIESATPAVVYIEVTSNMYRGRFLGHVGPTSSGSGFIVTPDGMVLTNAHVVANAVKVEVKLPNGVKHEGVVVDIDPVTDLAAVQLTGANTKFPYLKLGDSSKLRAGEWVAALGSPLTLSNTITAGIISSLHRGSEELGLRNREMKYIQTDAAINVGNSDGPLVNLDGEVVGINCITVQAASGISFAIPSDTASEFLKGAKERAKKLKDSPGLIPPKRRTIDRFYIGISMLTLTPAIAEELRQRSSRYSKVQGGVLVASVSRDSPADRAGLRTGDVIIAIGGKNVQNSKEIYDAVSKGEKVSLEVLRGSTIKVIEVKPEIAGKL